MRIIPIWMLGMDLTQLGKGQHGIVHRLRFNGEADAIAQRLLDLGFVPGEQVCCVARAPFGGDPVLVQIGHTRFALRRTEAARVQLEQATP
jgi:ferrous iron transport protein A